MIDRRPTIVVVNKITVASRSFSLSIAMQSGIEDQLIALVLRLVQIVFFFSKKLNVNTGMTRSHSRNICVLRNVRGGDSL